MTLLRLTSLEPPVALPRPSPSLWRFALPIFLALLTVATLGHGREAKPANVSWRDDGATVSLTNGRLTAVISKADARVTSLLFDGTQMVDPRGHIYYSMDGGENFAKPARCRFSVTSATPEMVDLVFHQEFAGASHQAFDLELHYLLRRGETGLYSFAVLDHPASYRATTVGEFRLVWKLPNDGKDFSFERVYVDAERTGDWGTYADFRAAEKTGISEIVKLTTGVRAGRFDCKYQFAARYSEIGCWGHASDRLGKGAWIVLSGQEYFNDGPTKQDLTLAENYNLVHLNRNHFGGSEIEVAAGEAWRKVFGPFLLYCNAAAPAPGVADRLWVDAKAIAAREAAAWPFAWLRHRDYPLAAARGAVTGRLTIRDPLKPKVSAARAWVGLAAPEETAGNWQDQAQGYQFWTRADEAGNFRIPHVRAGTYTLYAFNDGVVGEFSRQAVKVVAGETAALGATSWDVQHPGATIAWEIGTPDRTAREFRHGTDYFEPYRWKTFADELPNPLPFTIGTSDPAKDWNYAHSGYFADGTGKRWTWQIRFSLPELPAEGDATLTLALASAHQARLAIAVNDDANPIAQLDLTEPGGNALIREGIHAKYRLHYITIPVAKLRVGANTLSLVQTRANNAGDHVMYDYLSLELPGAGNPRVTSVRKAKAPAASSRREAEAEPKKEAVAPPRAAP